MRKALGFRALAHLRRTALVVLPLAFMATASLMRATEPWSPSLHSDSCWAGGVGT